MDTVRDPKLKICKHTVTETLHSCCDLNVISYLHLPKQRRNNDVASPAVAGLMLAVYQSSRDGRLRRQ